MLSVPVCHGYTQQMPLKGHWSDGHDLHTSDRSISFSVVADAVTTTQCVVVFCDDLSAACMTRST